MIVKVIERFTALEASVVDCKRSGQAALMAHIELTIIPLEWHYEDDDAPSYIELWSCHA